MLLVAAGRGERLGANLPKALVKVAGESLLQHSLSVISKLKPAELVVVYPEEFFEEFQRLTSQYSNLVLVPGGETRQQSVTNGLAKISSEYVLIHDAARAFAPVEVFLRVFEQLKKVPAVIPGVVVPDTVKKISATQVIETIDRSELLLAQTPQGFHSEKLRFALNQTTEQFTDEAALMQSQGHAVAWVAGHENSFKITFESDLEKANLLFAKPKTGIGTDVHAFSDSGELKLGLLSWPELPQLEGHSDGDSVAHAIVDALLGAAGLGDIGGNFGVDRPEYAGASGEVFIYAALELLAKNGFSAVNISVQVIGDKPKIAPRRAELEEKLSAVCGCPVSVSATTTDGLGFLADSKGIAAVATALVTRQS